MKVKFKHNNNKWRIIILYNQNIEEILGNVMQEIKEKEGYLLLGDDFNARTGDEGGPIGMVEEKEEKKSKFRDKVINEEGQINNVRKK